MVFIVWFVIFLNYQMEDNRDYSEEEIAKHIDFICKAAHLILEFSQEGGFDHAVAV